MGCLCPNFFKPSFKPCYLTPETPLLFSFSTENDASFYIPVQYSSISTRLAQILKSEPENWLSYKTFLTESKEYLHQTLNSIDNFLFQEAGNLESSSFPKKKIEYEGELGSPLDSIKESPLNSPNLDYYDKFRLKTFQIEINRLIFLGDNSPDDMNYIDPFIEIEISNDTQKYTFTSKILRSTAKKDFVWNELIQIPLEKSLDRTEIIKSQFSVSAYFLEKVNRKKCLLGEKYCFSFSELTHQMLVEKNIKIKNPNDRATGGCFAILLFRCQLIYDYFRLLNYWKKEIEVKLEIIQRMCQKIMVEEKGQKLRKIAVNNYNQKQEIEITDPGKNEKKNKANFSLMSGEGSEVNISSVYDHQYYLK